MAEFCPSCGTKLNEHANFCQGCGSDIGSVTDHESADTGDSPKSQATTWEEYLPDTLQIALAGVLMGLVAGGLIAWGLTNIGGSAGGFFVGWVAVTLYLWKKPTGVGTLGTGLYISALLLVLVPLFFYAPFLASTDPQTAEEVGMAIGGIIGLFVWTVVFAVIAAVMGSIGYFFKRRQSSKLENNDVS